MAYWNLSMQSIPLGSSSEYTKQLNAARNSSPQGPCAMPPRHGQSQLISPVSGLKAPCWPASSSSACGEPASGAAPSACCDSGLSCCCFCSCSCFSASACCASFASRSRARASISFLFWAMTLSTVTSSSSATGTVTCAVETVSPAPQLASPTLNSPVPGGRVIGNRGLPTRRVVREQRAGAVPVDRRARNTPPRRRPLPRPLLRGPRGGGRRAPGHRDARRGEGGRP